MGERLSSVFSLDGTLISSSAAPHCGGPFHERRRLGSIPLRLCSVYYISIRQNDGLFVSGYLSQTSDFRVREYAYSAVLLTYGGWSFSAKSHQGSVCL